MKKLKDEEIQKLLESQSYQTSPDFASTDEDTKIYELLFQELNKEPSINLPVNFAEKVTNKVWVEKKHHAIFNIQILLWFSIGAAVGLSILAVSYVHAAFINQSLSMFLSFKWIILFAVAIILLIELGDKYFVRRKMGVR